MDRSLDEILAERKPGSSSSSRGNPRNGGGGRGRRDRDRDRDRENFPRDGVRKSYRDREETRNLDMDWLHDRFEDTAPRRYNNHYRRESPPELPSKPQGAKLRVDNVHYELIEEDLDELFNRIGRVVKLELRYNRAGRSEGVAFVTYESLDDAREAIKQFDGANANGQPIRLALMSSGPAPSRGDAPQRNPFDTAIMPRRSLEERATLPASASASAGSASRPRSPPPGRDVDEAAKRGIDRYVPGGIRSGSPANPPLRRREGRRPGARAGGGGRGSNDGESGGRGRGGGGRDAGGRRGGGGGGGGGNNTRLKKTAEELDAEMADYFGGTADSSSKTEPRASPAVGVPGGSHVDDVDMIE